MFVRHSVFLLNSFQWGIRSSGIAKLHSMLSNYRTFSSNFHRRLLETREFKRNIGIHGFHNRKKNTVPIILGIAAISGSLVFAYTRLRKNSHPSSKDEEEADYELDAPYINERLEEDIKLLKEFGPIPYLLVGAGSASFTAYRAIRVGDPTAKVLMIGEEPYLPYMRPPLSKEMWFDEKSNISETLTFMQWNGKERSLYYEPEDYYFTIKDVLENKNGGVSIIRSKKVVKVDPVSQVVYLDTGEGISYKKCLIATGSKPKNLPVFEQADDSVKKHVTLFRTIRDFQKLDKISRKVGSIVVVGGGFLSSELACGLAKRGSSSGLNVVQVFPEYGNMGKILPEYLSKWTTKTLENEGVRVIPNVTVNSVSLSENKIKLHLSNDEVISADHVIVAVGSDPNTKLAKSSGLEVDEIHGGFLVNTEMEARKNLWIAGDSSCFYDTKLGRRRIEHHDHAVVSGRLAGENMTGSGKPYTHQSMFWSDLGPDIGFEAIGIVDSKLPTVGVFARVEADNKKTAESTYSETEERKQSIQRSNISSENEDQKATESTDSYGKGVIFYLKDNIIVGILLWNIFSKMHVARKIINETKSYNDLTEVAKLFDLHSTSDESN